ncbi:hypothetical protein SAMD00019534_032640 [Acytostelium subglobosum LB1]|uniref:hypothetical protein n=1 Tax=Acytostelium subglobosum LB1 TaxID=1410327 RepID=UPI0006449FAA|nr:hypothetical protein SAMD00019534_032640 [Acytostelium subglobosum LB1]GAM20089.1 hypothetical protein SAMD00019534_032640 [Acytostelium subglobosum LB1]|eukprot:XP_012756851.1 hypothetical protein SAMD00019534_032640 [Acytostelium subglobosum LB1]
MKSFQIICAFLFVTIAFAAATKSAYFVFSDKRNEFTIKLCDPVLIAHARGLANGTITDHKHIMGTIVTEPIWYNPQWNFYMNPTTISFFDSATEVCDASISITEGHLAEVGGSFLPDNVWCPWKSFIVREKI